MCFHVEQFFEMEIPKTKWLKFKVTEGQYESAKIAFAKSKERWFWRWCQKVFTKGVEEVNPSTAAPSVRQPLESPKKSLA